MRDYDSAQVRQRQTERLSLAHCRCRRVSLKDTARLGLNFAGDKRERNPAGDTFLRTVLSFSLARSEHSHRFVVQRRQPVPVKVQ